MSTFPLLWIDTFTERPFAGNPAAVVPLPSWPADEVMQRIAFENGLAETAFFVRTGPDRFHLRWFTPAVEMDLCGHATLASAFALFNHLGQSGDRVTFDSRSGPLVVTRRKDGRLELDFPALPVAPVAAPAALARGLGVKPELVLKGRDYVALLPDEAAVRAIRPNQAELGQLDTVGIIVTAPGSDSDFVSRFFGPRIGIAEDPVTGSAHCALTPFWAARLGRHQLHARQVSPRGGELWCELRGERVAIAGHAVLYLKGEIHV